MAKKHKKRKVKVSGGPSIPQVEPSQEPVIALARKPEIPAFWVAIIIPVICLVGAWFYPPVATPMELKSYTSQIYLSGLLLFWFWMQRKETSVTLTFSPGRISFGLLFLFGTLSLLWAANPDFWVYKWNKWYAGFIIFLLGLQITQNEKNLDTIVGLSILGGLITAIIGIAQYLFGFDLVPQTAFPSSTFGNGNMAGQVMVLTAPLPLYFLFKEKISAGKVWFYALSLCVLLTYTYYTRTRAVWIATGLEALLVLIFIFFDKTRRKSWLSWNKEKSRAALTALFLFLVLINLNQQGFQPFWEIAIYEISSIATSIGATAAQSGGQRYAIWGGAAEMIRNHPGIGTGLGSFFENVNNGGYDFFRTLGVQRAHNDVIELVVELGAVGFVLLLGIIVIVCIRLYKLLLGSEGEKRKLFALLIIAVTGSMLNAQLSFPYELPVPLIIMPFFMAIIIRGAEDVESNVRQISLKPWFNKAAISVCAVLFLLISVNDVLWFRDVQSLNRIIAGNVTNVEWKPINPVFNQVYITASRSVGQALRGTGRDQLTLNLMAPVIKYWPDSTANSLLAAESYLDLRKFEEAEYWARKTIETQPKDTYIGELYLMDIYQNSGDVEKLRVLYETMKANPESSLSQYPNTYNMLHSMSINLQDYDSTPLFFEKYMKYFGEYAPVIANQAVYYVNTGRIQEAIPYMKRALELEPNISLADTFKGYIAQYPDL